MSWAADAKCADAAPEERPLWTSDAAADQARAAELCQDCPVLLECLESAMHEERGAPSSGRASVRGGLTPGQRQTLHRNRRAAEMARGIDSRPPRARGPLFGRPAAVAS